ncbi:uncharacterized protein LOC112599647 [Melanaphis sacchari]|uniref:uncharacterized protein LOC112599647 n=1 Tax=Melanaphis sacchari TaxID=742174 RepID=UPI000DC13367|nr:uncharacterized protein LOC112599647 [Melanaphis sacchari]XP_025202419.1 uncharacterized protein LOC112599647 [Melanaphis sacchari]
MVYFTEKLINEVRKRSCIWDVADMNHLNKEVLTSTWTEIAENLYSDWHALSGFDKRDRVSDVKKKWTNIKDSFVKDVKGNKQRKSQCLPEHRKKYYLFDHLQFLLPFIQDSNSGGRSEHGGSEPVQRKKIRKNTFGEGSSRNSQPEVMIKCSVAPETAGRQETLQPDVQQHADLLNNVAGKTAADTLCQLDGDLSFMVSLLPTIKSMNEKQKINFKIGILQLVSRIKFGEILHHPSDGMYASFTPTTPDLGGFSVSSQPAVVMGVPTLQPYVNRSTMSLTQQHQQDQHHLLHKSAVKQEVIDSSPRKSSLGYDYGTDDDSC